MRSVHERRFYKASNKNLDYFTPSEPSSYNLNIDAKFSMGDNEILPNDKKHFFNN